MGREQSSGGVDGAGVREIADAHRQLLQDKSLQFDLPAYAPPPPPPKWAASLADLLAALGPLFQVIFWGLVALAVIGLLYLIARSLMGARFGGRPARRASSSGEPDWRPTVAQARVLLADADALAAEGRFDEAAHLLLLRGVEDIRAQRPGLVRPALTSRDIAGLEALPMAARAAFGAIALVVERSLFGGRDVGAEGWTVCRDAYERFALGGAS